MCGSRRTTRSGWRNPTFAPAAAAWRCPWAWRSGSSPCPTAWPDAPQLTTTGSPSSAGSNHPAVPHLTTRPSPVARFDPAPRQPALLADSGRPPAGMRTAAEAGAARFRAANVQDSHVLAGPGLLRQIAGGSPGDGDRVGPGQGALPPFSAPDSPVSGGSPVPKNTSGDSVSPPANSTTSAALVHPQSPP